MSKDPLFDEHRHPGAFVLVRSTKDHKLAKFNDLPWCDVPPPRWVRVGDTPATRGERDGLLLPCFWHLPIVYPEHDWCGLCKERMATHVAHVSGGRDELVCDKHAAYYRQMVYQDGSKPVVEELPPMMRLPKVDPT